MNHFFKEIQKFFDQKSYYMNFSSNQSKLQAVEVNDQSSGDFHGSFFIDLATHDTLKKLFQIYLLFLTIHFIGTCIAPSNFEQSSKVYSINYDPTIKFVEVDVTLSNLQPKNRLITAYGKVLRKDTQNDESILLNATSRSMYSYQFVITNLTDPFDFDIHANFVKNEKFSSSFLILNNTVNRYDLIQTRLNIGGDFSNIDGFNFYWTSTNPNSERFLCFAKLSILFFIIYVLIFFVPLRKYRIEVLTQKTLVILLFFALLSSIPITFLVYDKFAYLYECISVSVFIAIFRFFCIIQINITNDGDSTSQQKLITNLIILFLFTSILDSSSHFLRILEKEKPHELQYSILTVELLNSAVNLVVCAGLIFYCLSSWRRNRDSNLPRMIISISLLLVSSVISIFTEIIALFLKLRIQYIWPEMIFILYHLGTSILFAFLFRPADNLQYEDIGNNERKNSNIMSPGSVDLFGDD